MKEFYDIEHTLPFDDVMEDMERICANNGGSFHDIVPDFGIEFDEAMKRFYSSEVFEKLRDSDSRRV